MPNVARKAIAEVESLVSRLLERRLKPAHARDGRAPVLRVEIGVSDKERELLRLYLQPRGRETAVEYSVGAPDPRAIPRHPDRTPGRQPR